MRSVFRVFAAVGLALALIGVSGAVTSANHPPGPPDTLTVCHKPGTPAQKVLTLPHDAAMQHVAAHGDILGGCVVDRIIDADGTASATDGMPAAQDAGLVPGAALSSFPAAGTPPSGLDWFDNDGDGQWTWGATGDDLHSEDPSTCPGALRNGVHDLGLDCKVLDWDGSLFTGQQVDCDLEVNFPFTEPHLSNGGCPSTINNIRFHDADGDGGWDDGEDIVLDVNGNGIYD